MNHHLLRQQMTALVLIAFLLTSCGGGSNGAKTGFVEVDGMNIYYEMKGEGAPLVLIHGGFLDRRMWDDQFEVFSERYKVIRYDIPGFGKSDAPSSPFSNIEILNGLLTELNIESAHLLGLSLGGRIAIDFTLAYPQQVKSLILVAPGLSGYEMSVEEMQRMGEIKLTGLQQGAQAAAEKWLEDPYLVPAMENPTCREKVRRMVMDNAEFWVRPYPEQYFQQPADIRLSEIQVPTLIIVGDRDVKDILAIADLLDSGIADSQKEVINGVGHIVNMENKEEFNRIVLDFLIDLNP